MKKPDYVRKRCPAAVFGVLLIFLLNAPETASAETGVGMQAGGWFSSSPYFGPALCLSFTRRIHILLEYGIDMVVPYNRRFGICGDYWWLRPQVGDFGTEGGRVYLFFGAGLFIDYAAAKDWSGVLSGGLRFPFGVDYEIKRMDFFLQAAPALTVASTSKGDWFVFYTSFGFRWWF
ncbi:MAG: hypothetical protein LBG74_07985 [Spirochaetaceae bacterium]|jgi:hypothetical protein|nr:hypothetical protein [Spirochaetaceae bacterium]